MLDTGRPAGWRKAAVVGVFLTLGSSIAGVVFAAACILITIYPVANTPTLRDGRDVVAALLLGAAMQLIPLLVTAGVMAWRSSRLARAGDWLRLSSLSTAALASLEVLLILGGIILLRPSEFDFGFMAPRIGVTLLLFAGCGGAGGFGSAWASLRFRPRPATPGPEEVFS